VSHEPLFSNESKYPQVTSFTWATSSHSVPASDHPVIERSHKTLNNDRIETARFKIWWDYLVAHGSASLNPGGSNNPHPWRARIVGAIMATCLPGIVRKAGSGTIELVR
jgi:hypothetical protein